MNVQDLIQILEDFTNNVPVDGDALVNAILNKEVDLSAASDALEQMGLIENPYNENQRRVILESCLVSPSLWVRDGAYKGLSYIDSPLSLPAIVSASKMETSSRLINYTALIVKRLRQRGMGT